MSCVRSTLVTVLLGLILGIASLPAAAVEVELTAVQSGDDEREFAGGTCLQEEEFLAGTSSTSLHQKVGGEAWGCDSEWATSIEFDLSSIPVGLQVFSATLLVRKTGYSDDSQGFFYMGAFAYEATGAPVPVAREALTLDTMLDVVYPSAANVDLSFDVTAAVQEWVARGKRRVGLLLAGVYSEVGYENWVSVGGSGYAIPPRLHVSHEGSVAIARTPWTDVKEFYR
jgi:hypothetical protein